MLARNPAQFMSSNLHPMLNVAIKAARAAGAIINRAALDVESVRISQKQINDFVTEVDMNARGFRAVVTNLLTSGMKDVTIAFGAPIPLGPETDRKVVTKLAENQVRPMLVALNRHEQVLPAVAT